MSALFLIGAASSVSPTMAKNFLPSPAEVAAKIDRHFDGYWANEGVTCAPLADDAVFLRRVTLDVVGRIPTAAEARAFFADHDPHKRSDAIERLIDSPAYARHFASVWSRAWLPQTQAPPHDYLGEELERWLTAQLLQRTPYNQIVRELLSVAAPSSASAGSKNPGGRTPVTFLLANDMRPEELAANATREFLGVNLECAQCHDHPFASWKRDEFWETAAFFASSADMAKPPQIRIPDSDRVVAARLWTGEIVAWPVPREAATGRRIFAEWATGSGNSLFARHAVNQLWANLLGVGLCQPIDDLAHADQSPHAALLDELAKDFAESGFDLAYLTEAMLLSRVYQLSASGTRAGSPLATQADFSVAAVRSLSGEQLYDSLRLATGRRLLQPYLDSSNDLGVRRRFVDEFRAVHPEKPQRSVIQALALMNGEFANQLNDPTSSRLLAAAEAPFLDRRGTVEFMFLTVLSRLPTNEESDLLVERLTKAEVHGDSRRALADICWAMLNSVEFNTNH